MALEKRKVEKITRDQLDQYARYTSPVTIGARYKIKFDGAEPDLCAVSFKQDNGEYSDPYPAFKCEVIGGAADEKVLSLSLWKTRTTQAYDADGKLYSEELEGDFAQDDTLEQIYDQIKANGKDAVYECFGKPFRAKSQRGYFYTAYMRTLKKS